MSRSITRVVVALDEADGSRDVLRRAASLARVLHAELAGLFVEDENLLRLSGFDFARELSSSGAARVPSADALARELAGEADALERELRRVADELGVSWTFARRRGLVARELLRACENHALLVAGMRAAGGRRRLGSTARALLAARMPLMLVAAGAAESRATLVLFDGSPAARAALRTAALITPGEQPLQVLIRYRGADEREALARTADEVLAGRAARLHWLAARDGERLVETVIALSPATLVLGADPALDGRMLEDLVRRLDGAVLRVLAPED